MRLTLSSIDIKVERRYKLDEPVVCVTASSDRVLARTFITRTSTYEYGPEETFYFVYGMKAKADGTPDERSGHPDEHMMSAGLAAPFLEALSAAVDEVRP